MSNVTAAPQATCDPKLGIEIGCDLATRLEDTEFVMDRLFKPEHIAYLALIFLFIYLARWTFQIKLVMAFSGTGDFPMGTGFAKALTTDDNKALSLSFAAYLFAVGLILWASLTSLTDDAGLNILYICEWQLFGMFYLEVARLINDKLLLRSINNNVALVKDHNLAVGCAEAGSYVGTGLTVMAAVSGTPSPTCLAYQDIILSTMWFLLGQLMFVAFAFLINTRLFTRTMDFYDEMRKGNAAAGLLYGLNLVAVANLISNSVLKSDSLANFFVWFAVGGAVLLLARFLVDVLIIPGNSMDHEIKDDHNYGAALLVGGVPVALTFVLNTFLVDSCANPT